MSLLPEQMDKLIKLIQELELEINNPDLYTENPNKLNELSRKIAENRAALEILEARWLELEEIKSSFT